VAADFKTTQFVDPQHGARTLPSQARHRCFGQVAPTPTRLVSEKLAELLHARLTVFTGADHMGPFTRRTEVNALILSHLTGVQSRLQQA
jgi:pimeloyl-ACP methyl ester carboxylesterase